MFGCHKLRRLGPGRASSLTTGPASFACTCYFTACIEVGELTGNDPKALSSMYVSRNINGKISGRDSLYRTSIV